MQEAISFSFKPMQRLVKIELMVKGIRDKTPEGEEQWRLQSALGLIEDVCLYVNQIKCAIDDYTKQKEAKYQVGPSPFHFGQTSGEERKIPKN